MSGPLPRWLLPDTATIGEDGRLRIGGCDLLDLAEELGTPLFVYDEAHLRARCREAVAAFGDGVAYAAKAFLCLAMARLAHEEGMYLDVATGGELHVALAAGVPADRLVLHGNNKSLEELRRARTVRVGRHRRRQLRRARPPRHPAREDGCVPKVLIRATPGVEAHTHEFVRTGQVDSKFGFGVAGGRRRAGGRPGRRLVRPSSWSGSTCTSAARSSSPTSSTRRWRSWLRSCASVDLPELSIGGGLGVAYVEGEEAPVDHGVGHGHRPGCRDAGIEPGVTAEPGRAIAAQAAVTLYTVGTDQGRARRPHLRVRRRRHVRQPTARALRLRATRRSCPGPPTADRPHSR